MNNSLNYTNPSYKVIADHLRSSAFLIADGVSPSNEGRGYVLRRIMRRAMRHVHMLGAKEASMYKLVPVLIKEMGGAYPELKRANDVIIETLKTEEEKFRETLEKGLKILEEELIKRRIKWTPNNYSLSEIHEAVISLNTKPFSGKIAFKLYDTYGFPLDLTQDILREKNIEVNLEEFNSEMEIQRDRARKSWAGSGEQAEDKIFFELKEKFGETKFLGYEATISKAKIIEITQSPSGGNNGIVLDQTPFYATSGGQKGDSGKIFLASDKTKFVSITETKKFAGNFFVHFSNGIDNNYKFNIGDEVIAEVDSNRIKKASNHSATHLMHKALKQVLGNSISQKGSNVDAEYFTFDFNLNRGMTASEITKVEDLVNSYIRQNSIVKTELMSLDKARESGAEALFGEKYDNEVRVVSMSPSIELCGGTHVKATGDIGIFKILSEKGIAAGIRRIEAISGEAVIYYYRSQAEKLENEIENLKQDLKKKDKEIEKLKKEKLSGNSSSFVSEKIGEINLIHHCFDGVDAKGLRDLVTEIKNKKEYQNNSVILFFAEIEGKISAILAVSQDLTNKFDAGKLIGKVVEKIGGKGGGGKPDMAMGGGVNKNGIKEAILTIIDTIKS